MTNPSAQSPYPVTTQHPAKLGQLSSAEMQAEHTAMQLAWLAGICAALIPPAAFKKAQTHTSQKVHAPPIRHADLPFQTQAAIIVETAFYSHARLRNGPAANDASTAVLKRAPCCKPALPLEFRGGFQHCFALFHTFQPPFSLLPLSPTFGILLRLRPSP